ncbi:hypothetical protein NKH77_05655 [Streptomyces sp. M19]
MAENYAFPDELREAQQRLHAARSGLAKLHARLPRHTESWTDEEHAEVAELWRRQRELAVFVSTHTYWNALSGRTAYGRAAR